MELSELRKAAREAGYLLVHKDRVRTLTVNQRVSKLDVSLYGDKVRTVVEQDLAQHLAHFMMSQQVGTVQELLHEWDYEFRMDLTVLGPKTPPPDSPEHFIWRPRDDTPRI